MTASGLVTSAGLSTSGQITLLSPTTYVAPTTGQLGYTFTGTIPAVQYLSTSLIGIFTILSVPVGTWLINAYISLLNMSGTANVTLIPKFSINNVSNFHGSLIWQPGVYFQNTGTTVNTICFTSVYQNTGLQTLYVVGSGNSFGPRVELTSSYSFTRIA